MPIKAYLKLYNGRKNNKFKFLWILETKFTYLLCDRQTNGQTINTPLSLSIAVHSILSFNFFYIKFKYKITKILKREKLFCSVSWHFVHSSSRQFHSGRYIRMFFFEISIEVYFNTLFFQFTLDIKTCLP